MTAPPKFFVPAASTPEMAEEVLAAVRKFARTTMGEHISFGPRRIFRLRYRHNGQTLEAEVDKPEPLTGEPVIVILDANPYLICTPERGVVRGMPILVGAAAALEVTGSHRIDSTCRSSDDLAIAILRSVVQDPGDRGVAAA